MTKTNTIDRLVNEITAFSTFGEMLSCLRTGYVPTIYPTGPAHRKLIRIIRAHGFRVWSGK